MIPVDVSPDETIISRIFANLTQQQSFYSSCAVSYEFLNKSSHSHLAGTPKMILRNIYHNLLHDSSAPEYRSEAVVDENVTKAVLQRNDPNIILDLRRMNGKIKSSVFDLFWDELKLYLDETTLAVDERRHGEVIHMPFAISIAFYVI